MIYALQNKLTGELLACSQVNGYRLPYFGILQWEQPTSDEEIAAALKRANRDSEPIADWLPAELSEHQAKMANVKLRNDGRRRVYLQDGALVANLKEE